MSALANSVRLRSARTTTELYRACMNLSEAARSLSVHNEGMKRLGINAQVLAAQTGEQGGALEVIVAEIGRLSVGIRGILESLAWTARVLSATSIEVLHFSHLLGPLRQGWDAGIDAGSATAYARRMDRISELRNDRLGDLELRLAEVATLVADLARIAQQIPPVTTMIRIVATELSSRYEELMGTVEDLKSFHSILDGKIEGMREIHAAGATTMLELRKESR